MKTIFGVPAGVLALLAVVSFASAADPLVINGAGATFPYPLYSKWFYEYSNANPGVRFNYQSIGSGGGIKQITAGTVNFGATDAPMTDEEMKKSPGPILHVPTALGAVVPVYNLDGVASGLKLTPDVLAGIYLGDPRRAPSFCELRFHFSLAFCLSPGAVAVCFSASLMNTPSQLLMVSTGSMIFCASACRSS